ncbi:MAG: ASCH domain-containing protein [Thermodesulfobacteriota bacterium]
MIKDLWIGKILKGLKKWEIRGSKTNIRGRIALIQSGSGLVVGVCDLVNVLGPLTLTKMKRNIGRHRNPLSSLKRGLPYRKTYAWVFRNVRALQKPLPYKHPQGAIIWVKLNETVTKKLLRELDR